MHVVKTAGILVLLSLLAGAAFVYSGAFDPAADAPHSQPVHWLLENLRHRGIGRRVGGLQVPDLTDPQRISSGAGNYNAMCAGCHLQPGVTDSEMHRGLYPQPPALAVMARRTPPDHAFWIIKHGIKASGMPAWGKSMDDQAIWGLVAFLQQLPTLSADDYHETVEHSSGHAHGAAESASHGDKHEHGSGPSQRPP